MRDVRSREDKRNWYYAVSMETEVALLRLLFLRPFITAETSELNLSKCV